MPHPPASWKSCARSPKITLNNEKGGEYASCYSAQGKDQYPVPSAKILEALTAASCQETVCYERAELLGDAYLKWVVSIFLFLKYPQKHEGQLTRMRQQMVSNMVLYHYALNKGLQSYIQADHFSPSRWAAHVVLPVFDEETKESDSSMFGEESHGCDSESKNELYDDHSIENGREDGEIDGDSSCYRVLSSKTLADVVEALIGVYYVDGGKNAVNHLMCWIGIQVEFNLQELEFVNPNAIPESILRVVDFDTLEGILNVKFKNKGLLVEAIKHASRPSAGVSCYQRLEFVGDAVLDHLTTRHLFFTYTDLPPGRLTELRAAAVNNENFARLAFKHKLHLHAPSSWFKCSRGSDSRLCEGCSRRTIKAWIQFVLWSGRLQSSQSS